MNTNPSANLPVKGNITQVISLSIVIALLMTVFSALGLFFPDLVYPDPDLAQIFLTNDLVNIIIGLPLLLYALILLKSKKLLGLLLLPGALVYVIYNYIAYVLGKPLNWMTLLYLIIVILGSYALVCLLEAIDHPFIQKRLEGQVAEKFSGWVLLIFGVAFIGLALANIIKGIQEGTIPPLGEQAVSVADIVVSAGWVSGGILLLRRKALGYTTGLGLLMAASFLFIGLVLFFFFAPLLTGRPFDWTEVITVLVMGLVCFIPTALYWRGVIRSTKTSSE